MNKKITASVHFLLRDNSTTGEDPGSVAGFHMCDQGWHRQPYEVMDPDNFRHSFVDTQEEAEQDVSELVQDAMGLSGGVALGRVDITTTDVEPNEEREYNVAIENLASIIIQMVRKDYPDDVPLQRGESGGYLGSAVEDIQIKINNLL